MNSSVVYPRRRAVARQLAVRRRAMHLRADDALLIAYPKSGSTWLRFILAHLQGDGVDFDSVRSLVPPLDLLPKPEIAQRRGRLVKVHEQPRPGLLRRAGQAIYLVRDPVHVFLSYRDHLQASQHESLDVAQLVATFIAGRLDGYGRWDDHVRCAIEAHAANPDRLAVIRFEDLRREPVETVDAACRALGRPAEPDVIAVAVERSSAERMRELEASSVWLRRRRLPGSTPFVAGGGVRSDKELASEHRQQILDAFGPMVRAIEALP